MMKRRVIIEFPYEIPSWESWVDIYDFHKFCEENKLNILREWDVEEGEKYSLREIIVDLIYTADWEIGPRPVNGIDEHYMINEDDVVQEIINAVTESLK